ncbi:concanavalin A-like lectin/glucanase domain-containing protein [Aspergillus novoparasiticus]|uniref:chitinase n=1 Tax=Aspergillus novoparasiticus TaxID=986946 RepID=A0A5N6EQC7_9EURO|nr:concanavalin A-like lectin/glucanase domain-containing protein [Aspergillus novoparasiticus]
MGSTREKPIVRLPLKQDNCMEPDWRWVSSLPLFAVLQGIACRYHDLRITLTFETGSLRRIARRGDTQPYYYDSNVFMRPFRYVGILSALARIAVADEQTECNPLNATCPADPALGTEHTWWFNSTLDEKLWDMTTGVPTYTSEGAEFSIKTENGSTLLQSNFYIFFGVMEAHVKMAKGAGIISSVILQSDDLDEIDWEWVGYNTSQVQSDFFGKGNTTTSDRGGYHAVANADTEFHNYTSYWDKDRLEWWIDNELVRTVNYSEPLTVYGKNYPQTPCRVKVSNWPVGIASQSIGNIEWGGGLVNWTNLPFTMTVQRIRVQDFHSGKEYTYSGNSGSYDSINVVSGNSTAKTEINKKPAKTLAQKWDDLGKAAHIGVYCGAAAAGVLIVAGIAMWCVRQRRKGRLERGLAEGPPSTAKPIEMEDYKNRWRQSDWGHRGYQAVDQ